MKTAVSLPDDLFERAEEAARRLGRTRSALYAEALAAYLGQLDESHDPVTAMLDTVYERGGRPDEVGAAVGRALIDAGEWQW